jgi:hypothetical protein
MREIAAARVRGGDYDAFVDTTCGLFTEGALAIIPRAAASILRVDESEQANERRPIGIARKLLFPNTSARASCFPWRRADGSSTKHSHFGVPCRIASMYIFKEFKWRRLGFFGPAIVKLFAKRISAEGQRDFSARR